jgi:hypothetical protein
VVEEGSGLAVDKEQVSIGDTVMDMLDRYK